MLGKFDMDSCRSLSNSRASDIEQEQIVLEMSARSKLENNRKMGRVYPNIAKGTTDPRVELISQVQTKILINLHLQNLDQASTSKSQPNISISTKLKIQNIDQT